MVKQVIDAGKRTVPRFKKDGSPHKVDSVEYSCQECLNWFKKSEIEVDHIDPVVEPSKGFVDWNTYFDRLWCDPSNLQRLCLSCHEKKTVSDKIIRNSFKKGNALAQV